MSLVECVPNFSEGRNQKVLDAIAYAIASVPHVALLDIHKGAGANRSVMTFVGSPDSVAEAAFLAIAKAAELIDMRKQQGAHPRIGATDVCPFVPITKINMEDCVKIARILAARVGAELGIPVYLYGQAAQNNQRRNLAYIRKGEYEGLAERLSDPNFKPDFGPCEFNAKSGATAIGARQFLIAYNVNLNTKSQKMANEIAACIRESGHVKLDQRGSIVKDANGAITIEPGTLKACQAVGWYIDEYKKAQVSMNLIDYKITSIHDAYDECVRLAKKRGLQVTGSELVGLIPLEAMLMAGRHYLSMQGCSNLGISESELIEIAVKSLGLSELTIFDPQEKIIEYKIAKTNL